MDNNKSIKKLEFNISNLKKLMIAEVSESVIPPDPKNRFESHATLKKKAALEMESSLNALQQTLDLGLRSVMQALVEQKKQVEAQALSNWFAQHIDTFANIVPKDLDMGPLQEVVGFPKELLDILYGAACYLDDKTKYEEAVSVLSICLLFNSSLYPIWFTYGIVLQKKGAHEEAVYAFNIASILSEEENPYIYAHIARSLIPFKLWHEAGDFLNKALELCRDPDHEELKRYCTTLQSWIASRKS